MFSSSPLPQLVLLPTANNKHHRRKVRMMNERGWLCNKCKEIKEPEGLTVDHIFPKWTCPREYYRTRENKQLLCKTCHNHKTALEHLFLNKVVAKLVEYVHFKNVSVIHVSEVLQEFKEWIRRCIIET